MVNRHLSDFNKIMFHTTVIIMNKNKNKKDNQLTVSHLGGRHHPSQSNNEIRRPLLTQAVKGGAEGLMLWDGIQLGTPSCIKLLSPSFRLPVSLSAKPLVKGDVSFCPDGSERPGGFRSAFRPPILQPAKPLAKGNVEFLSSGGGAPKSFHPLCSPAGTDWS